MTEILEYQIDDPTSEFKFSDRLARENMWSKQYALRCIEEYKKFMYLASIHTKVTPSVQVDEVWHLHMLYTRDYRDFCQNLGKFIEHGPTKGGKQEDDRYLEQYNKTLELYKVYLGDYPEDIWPSAEVRFGPQDFVRVDLVKHYVVPVGDSKMLFKLLLKNIKYDLVHSIRRTWIARWYILLGKFRRR